MLFRDLPLVILNVLLFCILGGLIAIAWLHMPHDLAIFIVFCSGLGGGCVGMVVNERLTRR